jgi:hypothetical protein
MFKKFKFSIDLCTRRILLYFRCFDELWFDPPHSDSPLLHDLLGYVINKVKLKDDAHHQKHVERGPLVGSVGVEGLNQNACDYAIKSCAP